MTQLNNNNMKSRLFNLKLNDFVKGLILAVITGVITFLTDLTTTEIDWKKLAIASVIALLSYLVKNMFTNSNDQFMKPE